MSGITNRKFVIDFRSSQVRQGHLCIRLMVVKNVLIRLPMKETSLTQYLTYATNLPQDACDLRSYDSLTSNATLDKDVDMRNEYPFVTSHAFVKLIVNNLALTPCLKQREITLFLNAAWLRRSIRSQWYHCYKFLTVLDSISQ